MDNSSHTVAEYVAEQQRQKFYKLKMDLYASIEQKISEVMHTVRSIQHHEINAPGSDVDELKELNRTWAKLSELRQDACCMMDALHPMLD